MEEVKKYMNLDVTTSEFTVWHIYYEIKDLGQRLEFEF